MTPVIAQSRIMLVLLVLANSTIVAPAWAGGLPKTLAEYAKIAGEAGVAHSGCNMDLDFAAMRKLGAPFTLDPAKPGAVEEAAATVADAMNTAAERRQAEGEAFCAEALANYGPGGAVAPGLLKERPE